MCEEFVGVFGFDLRLSLISELHTHFFGGDILFLEPTIIFKDPFQTQKTFTSDQGKSSFRLYSSVFQVRLKDVAEQFNELNQRFLSRQCCITIDYRKPFMVPQTAPRAENS